MLAFTKSVFGSFLRFSSKNYASPEIYQKVEKILEERIRPAIRQDGGDVELHDIIDGTMIVTLSGACEGCGSKKSTLNYGILGLVNEEVPEVIGIREKMDFEDL